jgi:hypothetical protein
MQYRHGNFTSFDGEFGLRGFSVALLRSPRNLIMYERRTIAGFFEINAERTVAADASIAEFHSAITSRYNTIATVFHTQNVSSGFLTSGGAPSAIWLPNDSSLTGVKVQLLPSLEPQDGADYATGHLGSFSVSADYIPNEANQLVDYGESVTRQGNGGNLAAIILTDTERPIIVPTARFTPVFVTQSGYAVGLQGWPIENGPLWGQPYLQNPSEAVTTDTPRRVGNGLVEYRISWNYRFVFDGPPPGVVRPLIR